MPPGSSAPVIATASIVYFRARVAHAVVYAFGVPWLQTLAFAVDLAAQAVIAWQLLTA